MTTGRCRFNERARSLAEREAGCPLDHCANGHHPDAAGAGFNCSACEAAGLCGNCGGPAHKRSCEEACAEAAEVREAEVQAGWEVAP